jgi:hypothetical protein
MCVCVRARAREDVIARAIDELAGPAGPQTARACERRKEVGARADAVADADFCNFSFPSFSRAHLRVVAWVSARV